ncbi:MAG: DUF805 domain-containing protein [Alphaproteobacteria bacterium]|nr:DUF805 domain-containing protein [Alphaproteobacteria bacterium]
MVVRKEKSVKSVSERRAAPKEKMVSFGRAVANFFKKYFKFGGVATRAEYWWATLFVFLTLLVVMILAVLVQPYNMLLAAVIALFWLLFCTIIVVPMWAVASRRLHDAGFSAKILLISLFFFIYSILVPAYVVPGTWVVWAIDWLSFIWGVIMIILFVMPSKKQNNPYRD